MGVIELLRTYWGFDSFRPLQREIVDSVLAGNDTLALLPTGGGKSLCYQLPALASEGVTLVVTPLIALMKDQVRQLRSRGIVAEAVYSGMRADDIDRVLDNAVYGNTKLLYLSPERLLTDLARERIRRMPVARVAVDEAHCISQWGYDFRPPYLRIAELRELHPSVPFIAVTATATPEVVDDIQAQLQFRKGSCVFRQGFARHNLSYIVRRPPAKEQQLLSVLAGVSGSGIVYARSRGLTRELAHRLAQRGIAAAPYHAGLETEDKDRHQEEWLAGRVRIMVATNAFGMGIDKPDVRSVVHYGPPDSPEAYFQEAGRAGRDGKAGYGVLIYHPDDGHRLLRQWQASYPPVAEIRRMYRALGSYLQLAVGGGKGETYPFDLTVFARRFGFEVRQAYSGLKALELSGYLLLTDDLQQAATVQVVVTKEQLYNHQLRNPLIDRLMKSILRTTQGAFLNPVQIREGSLANFLKIGTEELQRTFEKMHAEGIIDYRAERKGPQLVFTEERIDPVNLRIDEARYRFLKERARQRIAIMIDYCENDDGCRAQRLLRYFGEADAAPCGNCDVCRSEAAMPPDAAGVLARITEVLGEQAQLNLADLPRIFGHQAAPAAAAIVRDLVNEGLLRQRGSQLLLP